METHQYFCTVANQAFLSEERLTEPEPVWSKRISELEKQFIEYRDWEARLRNKIKPKIGMTTDYIYRHVMDPPDSINETETARGRTMQWVYEADDGTQYFYFNERNVLTEECRELGTLQEQYGVPEIKCR